MSDLLKRAKQTQCCDQVIDGILGELIERVEKLEKAQAKKEQSADGS